MGEVTALLTAFLAQFWPYILAGVVGLLAMFKARQSGVNAERNAQKAKEADAYEKHIQDIERAAAAQPRGGVSDDPYNRDRP